jgi:AcrR family transcriptional regulator
MPPPRAKRPPKKRVSARFRRELILSAAKALFVKQGYGSTSVDQIAAAADVTKPVVYDHFDSKRDVYLAVMDRMRDTLMRSASAALTSDASPEERFRRAIECFFVEVKQDPAIVPLLFIQPRTHPDLLDAWQRLNTDAIAWLRPLAKGIAPQLSPIELDVAVQFLHFGLNAVGQTWPKAASVTTMTNIVVSLMWRGLSNLGEGKRRAATRR